MKIKLDLLFTICHAYILCAPYELNVFAGASYNSNILKQILKILSICLHINFTSLKCFI